jgi:hypothetical protein
MKIVLITTTVRVPNVLRLYRKLGPDVDFIVAGDHKSPHAEIEALAEELGKTRYLHPSAQAPWYVSSALGWNTIARRNIALLEAMAWSDTDVIVTVDDDNIPMGDFFGDIRRAFETPHTGLKAFLDPRAQAYFQYGVFDPGSLLLPPVRQRGVPETDVHTASSHQFTYTVDQPVGVVQGMCLGDPDIPAYLRFASRPVVPAVAEPLQNGVVFVPRQSAFTIFNTQSTAFLRRLAPAMFCPPRIGRYDDIIASIVTQKLMQEHDLAVRFGKPFVWQYRNTQSIPRNIQDELWGYKNFTAVVARINEFNLHGLDKPLRALWDFIHGIKEFPGDAAAAAKAFLDDVDHIRTQVAV